ncbi:hypothetical protein LTR74_017818 [Friedmanniomyces endolithicus]|nr:hypothetical protein LTR74_017818 [Friedmanniomyces endolithicus]
MPDPVRAVVLRAVSATWRQATDTTIFEMLWLEVVPTIVLSAIPTSVQAGRIVSAFDSGSPKFDGSNWTDFARIVSLARFTFVQDEDYDDSEELLRARPLIGPRQSTLTAMVRSPDELSWNSETPVFFAEFDRLTRSLGITSHETPGRHGGGQASRWP